MHQHFGQKTINLLHSSLKQKLIKIKIWKKCIYLNFENNTQNMIESVQYFQIKTAEDKWAKNVDKKFLRMLLFQK